MKVVILAGGFGTRLFEETVSKPKPLVSIGGMPILWHIMKIYSSNGFNEFVICLGYKKNVVIDYFKQNYTLVKSISGKNGAEFIFYNKLDNWQITLVDTGLETMTGGRLRKIRHLINSDLFFLSYGDTLSNVNIPKLLKFHNNENALVTLTTVQPRSNYGVLQLSEDKKTVKKFVEKPIQDGQWINGGYYVMDSKIFDYIEDDSISLEHEPLAKIVRKRRLAAYKHRGFWKSIETYKDKLELEDLWNSNQASWNTWEHKFGRVL